MSEDKEYGVLSKDDQKYLQDNGYTIMRNIDSSYDHILCLRLKQKVVN